VQSLGLNVQPVTGNGESHQIAEKNCSCGINNQTNKQCQSVVDWLEIQQLNIQLLDFEMD
jgi:hypothetical protein